MIRKLKHWLLWATLAIAILVTLTQLLQLYGLAGQNRLIGQLLADKDVGADELATSAPEVRMARSVYLSQHKRYDEALATLNLLLQQSGTEAQAQTRYNLGNLYLRQAMEKAQAGNINEAMPLLGLAKQAYREALMLDSDFWDAKYNLEVAMRLLPEMDRISSGDDKDDLSQKTQLWTTLPGFPRGLP
ncbi:MxaK protein [Methylomonas montana]|uniref:MxaK protein n=1 Tax=Methylomonas montana TaxID=3058963 RepID=UPI0026594461|nr:MxaK protein [Methylomonas montana]WKJ91984.1 MxaK protein [Methylomonas montana]